MLFDQKSHLLLASLALLLLVGIAYREAPKNTFHLDDHRNIVRHPPILITELTADSLMGAAQNARLPTRPLANITFALDWWRGDGTAKSFQITNIVIHSAATLAVFGLLMLVLTHAGQPPPAVRAAAFIAAALWACHPIQIQGVTYVVQRMTSMAALFTILTVILYILGRGSATAWRRWAFFGLAPVCWALGLMSKETAAIAPFLILLTEYGVLRHGNKLIRHRIDRAFICAPIVIGLLIIIDIGSGAGPLSDAFLPGYEKRDFTIGERLLTQPRVIALHLSQILWPLPGRFSLEHDLVVSSGLVTPVSTLFALLAVCCWCGYGAWALFQRRLRMVGFFFLWVPATLVIESTFIPLEMIFEHRMYLPSVALAGLAALFMTSAFARRDRMSAVAAAAGVLAVTLSIVSTSFRVPDWQSSISLAEASVKTAPNSARAWGNLANAYKEAGRGPMEVGPPMMKALKLNPNLRIALHLYALRMVELQQFERASEIVDRLRPHAREDHSILNTMGMLSLGQGDFNNAVTYFQEAIEWNSFVPEFRYNLALAYELLGECKQAQKTWTTYFEIERDEGKRANAMARFNRQFELEGSRCFARNQ